MNHFTSADAASCVSDDRFALLFKMVLYSNIGNNLLFVETAGKQLANIFSLVEANQSNLF